MRVLLVVLMLAGCAAEPAPPTFTSDHSLLKLRTAEWHACIAREFHTAVQRSVSRSVAAEFALGLCRTEENAIIGSAELSPEATTRLLTQVKAALKQKMIAGPPATPSTPPPPPARRYGI